MNSIIRNNKIKIQSQIKLQKLLIIKQNIIDNSIKSKYLLKWKLLNAQLKQYLNNENKNIKDFYLNYKQNNNEKDKNKSENENEKETQIINSSYHKKSVKYQPNNYFETSFKEDKLYSKKIVNYLNNNSININKEEYLNKSQPQINNFKNDIYDNNNSSPYKYNKLNLITSCQNEDINNINNKYNLISNSPNKQIPQGIYKKKRIINSKNSYINKDMHNNSCVIGEVNKSNFELNKTIENEKVFMNNSMVMGNRKINNKYKDIYYPKNVSPNLLDNESEYDISNFYLKEQLEFFNKNKYMNNNNIAYNKINIRYQKMYRDNDLNSEHNIGILEEQINEGTK